MTLAFPKPQFKNIRRKVRGTAKRAWTILKRTILGRDYHTCQNPECKCQAADVHHIIKRSLGGPDEEWNLISLCRTCHRRADNDPAFVIAILVAKRKMPGFRHERALKELRMRNWRLRKTE